MNRPASRFPDPRLDVFMGDVDPELGYRVRPRPADPPVDSVSVAGGGFPPPKGTTIPVYLAVEDCSLCGGTGTRFTIHGMSICGCVFRAAARNVFARLHGIQAKGPHHNARIFARRAEFIADVYLLGDRLFDGTDLKIFRLYCCEGREWCEVDRVVKLGRGRLFHAVYRIQQVFGYHAISSPLFPLCAYFGGIRALPEITIQDDSARARRAPVLRWGGGLESAVRPEWVN